jgi:hypothetical protein
MVVIKKRFKGSRGQGSKEKTGEKEETGEGRKGARNCPQSTDPLPQWKRKSYNGGFFGWVIDRGIKETSVLKQI